MAVINITEYKTKLLRDLIGSREIVEIIDSQANGYNPDKPESLIYRNLFPFLKIPENQGKADCYILLSVDITNIDKYNPAYAEYLITIWCVSHVNVMRIGDRLDTRIDLLAREVAELFDGKHNLGFSEFRLESNRELILNNNYQYRELKFSCKDLRRKIDKLGNKKRR